MTQHTFKMPTEHAKQLHKLIEGHTQAIKNWTASAVECGDFERAQKLVKELRNFQKLYVQFNITSKEQTAEYRGQPVQTIHEVHGAWEE